MEDFQNVAAEVAIKRNRVVEFLHAHKLQAVLLRRRENIAWITAGRSGRPVALPSETAIATLLLTADGRAFYFAANNEADRLAAEEFAGPGYEPIIHAWHGGYTDEQIRGLAGSGTIGSDTQRDGCAPINLSECRYKLLPTEIARYRTLASQTADAVATTVLGIAHGTAMAEVEARVCHALHGAGIEPTVLLIAADNRVRRYRHALTFAGEEKVDKFGMVNLCARRGGLSVSLTRYVHFGAMPAELAQKFAAAAEVYSRLLNSTRAGNTSAACFAVAKAAYAATGFAGEEEQHAQGGPTGYLERDWVATPNGTQVIETPQAFAWNPSIQGAKVEDTVLLLDGKVEVLTATPGLPTVTTTVDGIESTTAGVVIR